MFIEDTWRMTVENILYINPEIVKVHRGKWARCIASSAACWLSFNKQKWKEIIVELHLPKAEGCTLYCLWWINVIAFFPEIEIVLNFNFDFSCRLDYRSGCHQRFPKILLIAREQKLFWKYLSPFWFASLQYLVMCWLFMLQINTPRCKPSPTFLFTISHWLILSWRPLTCRSG